MSEPDYEYRVTCVVTEWHCIRDIYESCWDCGASPIDLHRRVETTGDELPWWGRVHELVYECPACGATLHGDEGRP